MNSINNDNFKYKLKLKNILDDLVLNFCKKVYKRYKEAQELKYKQSPKYLDLVNEYNKVLTFATINNHYIELFSISDLTNYDITLKKHKHTQKKIKSIKKSIKTKNLKINIDNKKVRKFDNHNIKKNYVGLTNINELNSFFKKYNSAFKEVYLKLTRIYNLFNKKYGYQPFVHLANNIINLNTFKPIYGNIWGKEEDIIYNPKGLWFSCGNAWLKDMVKGKSKFSEFTKIMESKGLYKVKNKQFIRFNGDWIPRNVYILNTNKLKLYSIKSCDDMLNFEKTYFNKDATKPVEIINWKQVYKDYDGLYICPYLEKKCFKHMSDIKQPNKYDYSYVFLKILKGDKTNKSDYSGFWASAFDSASGVIWKNYKNLKLIKIL